MRVALLLLAAVACAGPPPTRAPSEPTRVTKPKPEWRAFTYPTPPSWALRVERAPDGTERFLVGGARAERRGGKVTLSNELSVEHFMLSCPSDGGYLHFTGDNRLLWSKTFLGALEVVGFASEAALQRVVQCGPVVLGYSHDAKSFEILSRQGVRPLRVSDEIKVLRFSSPLVGRAVGFPDRLYKTTDGGRTFVEESRRPPPSGDDPASWLGGFFATPPWDELHDADARDVLVAWLRRAISSEIGARVGGTTLTDGTWVRSISANQANHVAFRAPNGSVSVEPLEGSCRLEPWGKRVLADCDNRGHTLRAIEPSGQRALPQPPQRWLKRFVADPSGRWIAGMSSVDDGQLLMLFDGERWQLHDKLSIDPIAIRDGWLFAMDSSERTALLLELAHPERGVKPLPGKVFSREEAGALRDRFVYLARDTLARDEPRTKLAWFTLDPAGARPLQTHLIHSDVSLIAFADAEHGVAAVHGKPIRVTRDSGQSFEPLADFEDWIPYLIYETRCYERGCGVGEGLVWTNEPLVSEPIVPFVARPVVPPEPAAVPAPDPAPSPPAPVAAKPPRYVCRSTPKLSPKAETDVLSWSEKLKHPERVPAVGGLFEQREGGLVWSGRDNSGDFRVETRALAAAGTPLRSSTSRLFSELWPALVARRFAVLMQRTERSASALVLRADGRTEELVANEKVEITAVTTPDGGATVLVRSPWRSDLLALDQNGVVAGHRWLMLQETLLGISASGPSLSIVKAGRAQTFSLVPGSPERDWAVRLGGAYVDCATSKTPPDAVTLVLTGDRAPIVVLDAGDPPIATGGPSMNSTAFGLLEVGPAGSCWRGVVAGLPLPIELRAEGGALRGTVVGPTRTHALECRRESEKRADR